MKLACWQVILCSFSTEIVRDVSYFRGHKDEWNCSERLDNPAFADFINPVMPIDLLNVPTEQIKRILEIRQQMDALRNELNQVPGVGPAPASSTTPGRPGRKKGKRYVSPEARQKMAEAQQRRWAAKRNAAPVEAEAKPKAKGKRVMTDEWRAKLSASQKARWAMQKGEATSAKEAKPAAKPAGKKKVSPEKLAALAKARAARWAKAKAAK